MALYLVQHGKSLPKDIDPDQGISETGRAESRAYRRGCRELWHQDSGNRSQRQEEPCRRPPFLPPPST